MKSQQSFTELSSNAAVTRGEVLAEEGGVIDARLVASVADTAMVGGREKESNGGGVKGGTAGLMTEDNSFSSARHIVSSHKVQKLLETNINDNFRELVLYMNDAVPGFLDSFLLPTGEKKVIEEEQSSSKKPERSTQRHVGTSSSAIALRSALESRVVDLHLHFLQEWTTLTEAFEEVSDLVTKLHQESAVLQKTLNSHAAVAEDFVGLMSTLHAELSLVQQREKEMREFQEKYCFTMEDRKLLEESPVDAAYLDILQRTQVTYRKCRELLLSREHYQSAAAMMDITYSAIMRGSEKVARYLMSALATTSGAASPSGDSHDITNFCLRCVQFLREENLSQWEIVVEEVVRLRRAAVLRQYFHLMTTGSATTSTGTYRAGVKSNETHVGSGGTRPLEAEIGNPVFFFSSLFAWLHQVIADEDDFLGAFFPPRPSQEVAKKTSTSSVAEVTDIGVVTVQSGRDFALTLEDTCDETGGVALPLSKASALDSVFEVLCKHIKSALEGVLERFLRNASCPHDSEVGACNMTGGGGGVSSGFIGPIGLTGGIARLLSAATGRTASLTSDPTSSTQWRYQHVVNRSQQETLVSETLMGFTKGLRTAHTLLQLLTYYSCSTFTALLGSEAALTRLVADDSKLQLLRVYHTIAKQLAERALDSVASIVSRCAVLRRLASADAAGVVGEAKEDKDTPTSFVTDYLFEYATEDDGDTDISTIHDDHTGLFQKQRQQRLLSLSSEGNLSGTGNRSGGINPYHRSGLSKQQAQSADLMRVLYSMVLPVPPEIREYLHVLQSTMVEAENNVEVMDSVRAMLSKSIVHEDFNATNSSAYHEQFFTVLVQHVLSFPVVLARHPTVNNALDEPCKLVLQLNTMCALQETLASHMGLLATGNAVADHTAPLSSAVSEKIEELTKALISVLSYCAVRHYFCRCSRSNSVVTAINSGFLGSGSSTNVVAVGKEFDFDGGQLDAPTIVAQLSEFYGLVAASGRVYIPLIAALQSSKLRQQVVQGVLQALCDVYNVRYLRLSELQQHVLQGTETTTNAIPFSFSAEDLDPQKLRALFDVVPS